MAILLFFVRYKFCVLNSNYSEEFFKLLASNFLRYVVVQCIPWYTFLTVHVILCFVQTVEDGQQL